MFCAYTRGLITGPGSHKWTIWRYNLVRRNIIGRNKQINKQMVHVRSAVALKKSIRIYTYTYVHLIHIIFIIYLDTLKTARI